MLDPAATASANSRSTDPKGGCINATAASRGCESDAIVVDSDQGSDLDTAPSKKKTAKGKKPLKWQKISSFMIGGKRCASSEEDKYAIIKPSKKKKKAALPYSKTRPSLAALSLIRPPPIRPNENTIFEPDAEGRRMHHHWFKERTWMELCPKTCKVKCCMCRSQFNFLPNKAELISKKQDTFAAVGYSGNKHMLQKLCDHKNSESHACCIELHDIKVKQQQSTREELDIKLKSQ